MGRKRIYLSPPTMHGRERELVGDAFDSNWLAPVGPHVDGFEQDIMDYTGAEHACALSCGTAALHLGLKVSGIRKGDTVICQSLTFAGSCNPICYEGGTPVFVDSEPDTWNMSPEALERALEAHPETKAVIPVHLYGTPAKMQEIMDICEAHKVLIVEDAAESLGATYKGKQTGTFGHVGIYSFNGNKIITTSSGGMLVSSHKELTDKARHLSTQAREPGNFYHHLEIGYNYRLSNVLAAMGRGQMESLDAHITKKKMMYEFYSEAFKDIEEISMNPLNKDGEANYWLSCILIDRACRVTPDDVIAALEEENIESRRIWKPMHLQPVYADCDFYTHTEGHKPVSDEIFERGVCLPSNLMSTDEDLELIARTVRRVFGR